LGRVIFIYRREHCEKKVDWFFILPIFFQVEEEEGVLLCVVRDVCVL